MAFAPIRPLTQNLRATVLKQSAPSMRAQSYRPNKSRIPAPLAKRDFDLAAVPAIGLAALSRAYRSGARKHEVMAVMAKPLTDDDIQNLAAWSRSIRIEATAP